MLTLVFPLLFVLSSARNDLNFVHSEPFNYCYLTEKVTINLHYHQIVLLIDKDMQQTRAQTEYLKKCILQEHPTMLIDFNSLHVVKTRLRYPSFGSPRSTTFYMLLYHRDSDLNFQDVLNDYIELWPQSIRPKWLSIDLSSDNIITPSKSKYNLLLLDAWRHKFLDFTLVEIKGSNQTVLHSYNPFTEQFTAEIFTHETDIFPDKLMNMHGHTLKTRFIHEPPSLYLEQDKFGKIVGINGTDYRIIRTLSQVLKFNLNYTLTFDNDDIIDRNKTCFREMTELVYNDSIDFTGNQLYLWGDDKLQRSYRLWPDGQCALLPVRPEERIRIPKSFNLILGFSAIYILLITAVARVMKFDQKFWSWLTMIRVIYLIDIKKKKDKKKLNIVKISFYFLGTPRDHYSRSAICIKRTNPYGLHNLIVIFLCVRLLLKNDRFESENRKYNV